MRVKLIMGGEFDGEGKSAYLAHIRDDVRGWVADPGHGAISEWPAILDTLATIAEGVPGDSKFPPHVAGAIEAMTEEAIATLAALTGRIGVHFGMNAETMVATHHATGDAVTGTAIAGFMLGRQITGAETQILAHLLRTLDIDQRASLVCMAVAFLCVSGFTADDIRKLEYPPIESTSADHAASIVDGCTCRYCEMGRAASNADVTD